MKAVLVVIPFALLGALTQPRSPAAEPGAKVYELRIYTAAPGRLDAVNARFRDHTCKLFEKHGMTNVGYWTAAEKDDGKLYYILEHASKAAADESWKAFGADPEWKAVVKQTEANGKIVAKVDRTFMTATYYSPPVKAPAGSHVYELRTYTAEPGRLDALNARFRDHTTKLFDKHGITNVGYWMPMKGQKGADNTLIYLLAHKDMNAAKQSWDEFRNDPDWTTAKKASEDKAGGPLTVPGGVKSVYLKPTDYSAMR
ncbi:MAG TPA: NIPSNAP family protein [Gemmataceae bacterium]|nr:NIPSNAP family protein [Gemmataceae bacterium]